MAGAILAPALLLGSAVIASFLSPPFRLILLTYYLLTVMYSLYFRRKLLVDLHCLAALYTIRVIAGGAATTIPLSFWLLAFSMFLFLSLAMAKRYSDLQQSKTVNTENQGRSYRAGDLQSIATLGVSSSLVSVLVLALYINSPQVIGLYSAPFALWLLCPLLLYWTTRVWMIVYRNEMHSDPIVFALRDRISYAVFSLAAAVLIIATYGSTLHFNGSGWLIH
jgi:4-hydroxybenzoate polyprenyltransferase